MPPTFLRILLLTTVAVALAIPSEHGSAPGRSTSSIKEEPPSSFHSQPHPLSLPPPPLPQSADDPFTLDKSHPSTGPFSNPRQTRFSTNRPIQPDADIDNTYTKHSSSQAHLSSDMPSSQPQNNGATSNPTSRPTTTMLPDTFFPDPIVYQYTLYYPGNIPLIITAGHGGGSIPGKPATRKMTHRFTRVPDLWSASYPLSASSFSVPFKRQPGQGRHDEQDGETMPWMPPRDPSKGGNFKKDLNTHSTALNIANAVACLTNGPDSDAGKDIPTRCTAKGQPWGDRESDSPFPPWPSPSKTGDTAPSTGRDNHPRQQPEARYPHVVVFRVHRRFVDVNRNMTGENAIAEGHPVSEAAWSEYHDLIDHVQKIIQQQSGPELRQEGHLGRGQSVLRPHEGDAAQAGKTASTLPGSLPQLAREGGSSVTKGLLLDIHGHAHSTNLIEIGYLLSGTDLAMDNETMDAQATKLTEQMSCRDLASRVLDLSSESTSASMAPLGMQLSTLIRGRKVSLGAMLQAQGLNAVPSPEHPSPCQECTYFFGGFTIQQHGSRDSFQASPTLSGDKDWEAGPFSPQSDADIAPNGSRQAPPVMDAIQLELPSPLRLVEKEEGRVVGMKLGRAVVEFMVRYYGLDKTLGNGMSAWQPMHRFLHEPSQQEITGDAMEDTRQTHGSSEFHHQHRDQYQRPRRLRSNSWESNSGDSEAEEVAEVVLELEREKDVEGEVVAAEAAQRPVVTMKRQVSRL